MLVSYPYNRYVRLSKDSVMVFELVEVYELDEPHMNLMSSMNSYELTELDERKIIG